MNNPFTIGRPTQAQSTATQIKNSSNSLYQEIVKNYVANYNLVWNNPRLEANVIIDAMGTEAVKLFTLSGALGQILAAAGATDIPLTMPTNWTFEAHQDGSVTVIKLPDPTPTVTDVPEPTLTDTPGA